MTGSVKVIYVIWITTVIFLIFLTSPSVNLKMYNTFEKNVIQSLNIFKSVYVNLYITFGKLIFNVNIYAFSSVKTKKLFLLNIFL